MSQLTSATLGALVTLPGALLLTPGDVRMLLQMIEAGSVSRAVSSPEGHIMTRWCTYLKLGTLIN